MIYSKYLLIILSFLFIACGGSSSSSSGGKGATVPLQYFPAKNSTNMTQFVTATGTNVVPVTVGGSLCGNNPYVNQPCVSVTICVPGTATCQTINNILLDTGSFGLRVFQSVISNLSLPSVTNTSGYPYGTCATFGIGADWGSVKKADVILGSEKASGISIQAIDSSFNNFSGNCNNGQVDTNPTTAGFNGILGVGGFIHDCGTTCTSLVNNGIYYACSGGTCTGSSISLANQISNPIVSMPTDNNGSILVLPDVASTGGTSTGVFILGIGTSSNNSPPGGMNILTASAANGYISTSFNSKTLNSILDSGTNAFSFYDNAVSICTDISSFYCPSTTLTINPLQTGTNSVQTAPTIYVQNTDSLIATNNIVFNNLAFTNSSASNLFIYGLPFYLGKAVFMGIETKSSSLASGIYWAY